MEVYKPVFFFFLLSLGEGATGHGNPLLDLTIGAPDPSGPGRDQRATTTTTPPGASGPYLGFAGGPSSREDIVSMSRSRDLLVYKPVGYKPFFLLTRKMKETDF